MLIICGIANAEPRIEQFLDETYIESYSDIFFGVNKPVKYGSNPIFGNAAWTWDEDLIWNTVINNSDTDWQAWLGCLDNSGGETIFAGTSYATSSDGIAWSKPNIGSTIGSYANSNLVSDWYDHSLFINKYATVPTQRYIFSVNDIYAPGYPGIGVFSLYSSWNGIEGLSSPLKIIYNTTPTKEAYGITQQISTGKWLAYYHEIVDSMRRISVFLSDSSEWDAPGTALTGTWTDYTDIISAGSESDQKYSISVIPYGNLYIGLVSRYDESITQRVDTIQLYISRNGIDWTLLDSDWLPAGSNIADWDYGMVYPGERFNTVGDTIRLYYSGCKQTHGTNPRECRLGYSYINNYRIGQVAGTGNVVITLISQPNGSLYVNANATGGKIEVELLDPEDNVITGYAQADCDDITSDTYETEVTWGGNHFPSNQNAKIKFYLTDSILYSYEVKQFSGGQW